MKKYNTMQGIGKSKYIVNFHNGDKFHSDGSPFYDIRFFKNKVQRNKFVKELKEEGYNGN